MSNSECFFFKHCNKISCGPKSGWTRLSEVRNEYITRTCFPEGETVLEVMLLRGDLFFQHTFSLENNFVCTTHYDMLLQPFYVKDKSYCDVCEHVKGRGTKKKGGLRNINVSQAITLFENFRMKNSYGKLICTTCRIKLTESEDPSRFELYSDAFACLFDQENACCQESSDVDYCPSYEISYGDNKIKEQRVALNAFLAACGSRKKILRSESYKNLSRRTKLRYICLGKYIMRAVATFMAKDESEQFVRNVCSAVDSEDENSNMKLDGNFCQVLNGVSEAYNNADSWQSRREILSIIAPKVSLKLLQFFIPGLTEFRFSAARFHATKYGIGSRVVETAGLKQRFNDAQIAHFIDFIISPHVCIDLPFGEKTLTLSSGVELYVPNTIRNMGPSRIIDQYLLYCEEMCVDFHPLARSSLFTILDVCKASTRKSLQGIDYFAANAGEGFEGIKRLIESSVYLSSESNRLIENLKKARLYLKSDYKVHISRSSNVADHCCIYALSDTEKKDFSHNCDHDHEEVCHECENITNTLNEIECLIETSETDSELLDRSLTKFRLYRESIEAWKAHLLRSFNQDLCREEILDSLSEDEIYINMDWAMKFLPIKSREPQSDFFGKRGISWHIIVVLKNRSGVESVNTILDESYESSEEKMVIDGFDTTDMSEELENDETVSVQERKKLFEYKIFVHVFDECTQDSEAVLAILKDVLNRVKISDPQITKAFIRSDNAACYHSADTIVSAMQLSKLTGVAVKRVDFCDPQGGKGPCDRYAAVIKSNVRRYLNENHNVTNASEFVEACHSYRGVKGVLALICRIEKESNINNKKCVIKQIMNYNNFVYRADGLLVHRSWNVGPGLLINWSRLKLDNNIPIIISSTNKVNRHEWVYTKEKDDTSSMDTDDCSTNTDEILSNSNEQTKLYECDVEEGCTAEFMKFGNLINHILLGKHHRSIERYSLKDTAMKVYHWKLEEVGNRRMISVDLALKETNQTERKSREKGWALPIRKPHKGFSSKQRDYLKMKFNEGVSNVKHWKPKDIVIDMENLRVNGKFYFTADEILTENQVRSFFSRLKQEREKHTSIEPSVQRVDKVTTLVENIDTDDEEKLDSDLEALNNFRDSEAAIEETTVIASIFSLAKRALETCDA